MNRAQNYAPRSWTESEQPVRRRPLLVALLFLLLIAVVSLFIWWVLPKPEQRVFAVGFAIEESSERHLPRPAFARWDLSGLQSETWNPWLLSDVNHQPISVLDQPLEFCKRIENGPQLRDISERVQAQMRDAQATSRDTLIIYLRGLGLLFPKKDQTAGPQLFLLAPEDTSLSQEPEGISIADFLGGLTRTKAANVVVLADIADLEAAPQLGLLENDLAAAVAPIMEGLGSKGQQTGNTPVWLVLSRGSTQPNHVSYLLKKTLMQSAAEYALSAVSANDKQRHLPLTDFYTAMLRYAHSVTGGQQTPLLFRSGLATPIRDTALPAWQDAEQVHVALRNEIRTLPAKPPVESATASLHGRATVNSLPTQDDHPANIGPKNYFVATSVNALQQSTPQPEANPGTITAPAEGTVASPAPDPPEADPWLRFWQLRDDLAGRKGDSGLGAGWSPADFAVDRWQEIQREALLKERLWRLSLSSEGSLLNPSNLQVDINGLSSQLQQVSQGLRSDSAIGQPSQPIASTWTSARTQLAGPNNPQRGWLYPTLIAGDLQPRWIDHRDKLRLFVDICCESAAWMDLCLERAIYSRGSGVGPMANEVDQLRPRVYDLVDQIKAFKEQVSVRSTILDRPWNWTVLDNILSIHSELRQDLDRIVVECKAVLDSESEPMTWQLERTIQTLLESSLLSYQQRKSLHVYYSKSEALESRLRRPGHNNLSVDSDVSLSRLLPAATSDTLDTRIWNRKLVELMEGSSSADQWIRACFRVTWPLAVLKDGSQQPAGMLLPVSGDTGLAVVNLLSGQSYRHQLPSPLTVTLRHRNGTSIDNCWMDWKQLSSPSEGNRYRIEAGLADRSDLLRPESPHRITLNRDECSIAFGLSDGTQLPLEGISIQLRFARQESELDAADPLTVVLLPENPNRIDLFVRRWDIANDRLETAVTTTVEKGNDLLLRDVVQSPAIDNQAKSQYQLYLCNRSETDRVVRARFYGVLSPLDSGNGEVTDEAILRTRREPLRNLSLVATVPSLPLPGSPLRLLSAQSGQLPDNAREMKLPAFETGPKKQGRYGLLLVIDDAPAEGTGSAEVNGKAQYIWIDCLSQPPCPLGQPDQWLLQIAAKRRENSDVDFEIQVPDSNWNRWGLEKLRVELLLTDERGEKVSNRSASVAELSPQSSDAILSVRPNFDSLARATDDPNYQPEKIVVHFHVGGYPRAAAFQYSVAGGIPAAASQAFLWLDPNTDPTDLTTEILLTGSENQKLAVNKLDSRTFVIPNMLNVTEKSTGMPANAQQLSIPFRFDFPKTARNFSATVRLGSLTQVELRHDREYDSEIDVIGGRLSFSSAARDHRYTVGGVFNNSLLRGRLPLSVSINDTDVQQQVSLIFDAEKPQISKVELPNGSSLYEGESIQVELNALDEGSEIKEVHFAINTERTNQQIIQYDDQDDAPVKAVYSGGRWTATIKHDTLASAELLRSVGSSYEIVARSIDWAGNVQDAHRPARFFWQGKRKSTPQKTPK